MAQEVVYARVLPKEKVHPPEQTSDRDEPTTYAEVKVKWEADTAGSTAETTHTVTCLQNPHWCCVVVSLYFTAVILLITVILLAVKCTG